MKPEGIFQKIILYAMLNIKRYGEGRSKRGKYLPAGYFLNVLMHTFCVVCFLSVDNTWVITYEFNGFKKNVQLN